LNRSVGAILHLDRKKLTPYQGPYDTFEDTRRARLEQQVAEKRKQDAARAHMQSFVDRFRAKASKAVQAQSRVKMLEKMTPITPPEEAKKQVFTFPAPEELSPPIVNLDGAAVGYGGAPVLRRLNLRIDQDDRIALLGQNGNGKSTFAKLIAGKLAPLSGQVFGGKRVDVGYFAQHQLDELNPAATPYDHMLKLMPEATEAQRRTRLGTYGFSADKADTKCAKLSGGEKARLLLALAAFHAPHLLILDEPTNHLDVDSREALVHALAEYEGAVILISHDRHLIEACADRLWVVRGGTVKAYDGDMDSYRADLLAERGAGTRGQNKGAKADAARSARSDQRRAAADRRANLAPLKKAMQAAERKVETIGADIARLDAKLADPQLYAKDPSAAQSAAIERGQLAKRLSEAEEAWLLASEAYEAAHADASDAAEA
jgi:ATP-binding cassette subfamily F protein 3